MGGFTVIRLGDKSEESIARQNRLLDGYKVNKKYRFYGEEDIKAQYQYYLKGDGNWPEHTFPKDKITDYESFKVYWNPKNVGECFVPNNGTLVFDCYFGRTSKRAMRGIGRYIADHHQEIESTGGSFETFMERGMTKIERKIIEESKINYK